MKNLKKIASLLLALMIVLAAMAPAFAAEETGSITINGVEVIKAHAHTASCYTGGDTNTDPICGKEENSKDRLTNTYIVYKMLDLESYVHNSDTDQVYSYKVESAWEGFFAEGQAGANYMVIDEQGYATWKKDVADEGSVVADFAKAALAYAEANNITPVTDTEKGTYALGTTTDTEGNTINTVKFEGLELGYYLIDSTMGALCGLTTTNPNASINAKNAAPTLDKQVKEDLTGNWGGSNTAGINEVVEFRTTISVHSGAQNYVLHDKMSAGLTFDPASVKGYHVLSTSRADDTGTLIPTTYYTVNTSPTDGCTFEVVFTEEFCNHLSTNDKVIIYYSAKVNEKAVIAGDGNPNEAWLDFGEDHETTHDTTTTKTYGFDLIKTNSVYTLIDGAEFRLYDAATGGNEIKVVPHEYGEDEKGVERVLVYRVAVDGDEIPEGGYNIVAKNGAVRVVGLDNGNYYLEEVVSPVGYNKLSERKAFTISDANLNAIFNEGVYSTESGVHVINKSGTMLPETGGIGTTLFYVVGGVLVAAAVVLLVTRKRMSEK